jgi:DNA polymerase III subunit delta'
MPLSNFQQQFPVLVQRLLQAKTNKRISHAYMISGDSAETIETFAMDWIRACICEETTVDSDACGMCRSCMTVENRTHPYLYEIRPQSKSRVIRIDDVRELESRLSLKTDGEYKIAVFHDADQMNENAQNAFLKTLEEPYPNTLLLLLTRNPKKLLTTIRSRCQHIALRENRVLYTFDGVDELIRRLSGMRKGKGALTVMTVSEWLKASSDEQNTDHLSSEQKKKRDEERKAAESALYLQKRESVLSCLHCWFAQEYLRSTGVEISALPNPEFYDHLPASYVETRDESDLAERSFESSDGLLRQLGFNVDESTAIREFCQSLCAKG